MAQDPLRPSSEAELCEMMSAAAAGGAKLEIRGGGSKQQTGRPREAQLLNISALTGVVDYDPPELVLTVRPGTKLTELVPLLAAQNQMLAFEPFDHGPLFGHPAGAATIGGIVAAGTAGAARLSAGGARDHLLGCRAVSGRGEVFVSGAKVVKNVTGYDLPKLLAGSWGRLAVLTELTLKVLPAPRETATRLLHGLNAEQAVAAMAAAMGSQASIAAAAHLPGATPITAFRLQGFHESVAARCAGLARHLAAFGPLTDPGIEGAAIWENLRTLSPLPANRPLWRINIPPSRAPALVARLERAGAAWLLDWAGGLAWVTHEDDALVRAAATDATGHAMLLRAGAEMRARVPALPPQPAPLAALEQRIRRAFDPLGIFETGRF